MTTSLGFPRRSVKSPDLSMFKAHLIVLTVAHLWSMHAVAKCMERIASVGELDGM